jgi:hypothetical protein
MRIAAGPNTKCSVLAAIEIARQVLALLVVLEQVAFTIATLRAVLPNVQSRNELQDRLIMGDSALRRGYSPMPHLEAFRFVFQSSSA